MQKLTYKVALITGAGADVDAGAATARLCPSRILGNCRKMTKQPKADDYIIE